MFYGSYVLNGIKDGGIYDSWELFHRDTFSPLCKEVTLISFVTHGKSYSERKESVRSIAVDWSNTDTYPLSWAEEHRVTEWFDRMGKRYGLLEEFRENGLC